MTRFTLSPTAIPAIILAGGHSSRMGRNKAFVDLAGKTMLARIKARIAAQAGPLALNADTSWPDAMGLRLVADTLPGRAGPLAGVLAAMRDTVTHHPDATHVATVPVDSPFFPDDLLSRLAAAIEGPDEIAIASSESRDHPVFGLWPVSAADDLEQWLANETHRRMHHFLLRHAVTEVGFPPVETPIGPLDPFFNVNTPEDLVRAQAWAEALAS
jgi:molybdopterin-guanine dinucleotide biosynthesis protein A